MDEQKVKLCSRKGVGVVLLAGQEVVFLRTVSNYPSPILYDIGGAVSKKVMQVGSISGAK